MYRLYCQLVQLTTRLPFVLLATLMDRGLMGESVRRFFDWPALRHIRFLPETLQLTAAILITLLCMILVVSLLYHNLPATTAKVTVLPMAAAQLRVLLHPGDARVRLIAAWSLLLLLLIPALLHRLLGTMLERMHPTPYAMRRFAFICVGLALALLTAAALFIPQWIYLGPKASGVPWGALLLLAVPVCLMLDLIALWTSSQPASLPRFSGVSLIGAACIAILGYPIWLFIHGMLPAH